MTPCFFKGNFDLPARQLLNHLPCALGQRLRFASPRFIVLFGGRERAHPRQRPDALCPGYRCQPHQADPAQATGFDEMALAGPDWIAIDAARRDLMAPPPFNRLIDPADHRFIRAIKSTEQQPQQRLGQLQRAPYRSVEDLMVLRKLHVVLQSHRAQGCRNRALPRRQKRANQQDLCFHPRRHTLKTWRKWVDQVYDCGGRLSMFHPLLEV
jgi:hypothetical protein